MNPSRALRWTATPLMLLAMAACQKNGTSSTPPAATPPPQAAPPKIVSAEPTSFDAVGKHLDTGGGLYFYLSTESFLKTASAKLAELEPLIKGALKPADQAKATEVWNSLSRLAAHSGINEISGFGASSIALEPGYYQTKWMLHHYEGKGNGVLWKLSGSASDALDILPYLPEHTALASSGDLTLKPVWDALEQEAGTNADLRQGLAAFTQQLEAKSGLKLANLIASIGPRYSVVVTLDESRQATIPAGGNGKTITIPEPALAILVQVQDEALLNRVEQELAKVPSIMAADQGDLKMRIIPSPVPLPFVRPAVAWTKDTLIVSSNENLIREMVEVKAGKKAGLAASAEFKKLTADLPSPACQFQFTAPSFQKAVQSFQMASVQQQANGNPAIQRLLQSLYSAMPDRWMCSVVRNTPEGWVGYSRGGAGPAQLIAIGAIAPAAIVAGMSVPIYTSIQERGKQTQSLSHAKQIYLACKLYAADHEGNFPQNLEQLVPTYLQDRRILACPLMNDQTVVGYDYFGGKDSDPASKILLISKAATKNGMKIVVTCDGAGSVRSMPPNATGAGTGPRPPSP